MDGLKISTGVNINSELTTGRTSSIGGSSTQDLRSNTGGPSFSDTLKNAISSVDGLQKDADLKMQQLATGQNNNIHETMIAAEKADIALRLMVQVRNKIIAAYEEIMRMQV
jgi:flagellar hook-basal body complex protein FliE